MFSEKFFPRFGETDACGHINNTVLPIWMEHARNPVLRIFQPDFDPHTWNTIVAHIGVDFTAQLYLQYEIEVRTWIAKIGNSSFEIYQEIWQNEKLGAKGKAIIIHYDFATQKSVPIPYDIREELSKHLL